MNLNITYVYMKAIIRIKLNLTDIHINLNIFDLY